jgi:hypothetical protein
MDPDFTALASRVAARAEVLGCVILSRDGLVLGAFPPNGEQDITPGLLRFAALGDPDRGFAEFPDELWAYVRAGTYAAFAVAEHGTRAGVLIDYLEQALEVAEEARASHSAMQEPAHVDLSKKSTRLGRRLRASTHDPANEFRAAVAAPRQHEARAEPAPREIPAVPAVDDTAIDEAIAAALAAGGHDDHALDGDDADRAPEIEIRPVRGDIPAELMGAPQPVGGREPDFAEPGPPRAPAEGPPAHESLHEQRPPNPPVSPDEIDRVALAREFAQLLQEGPAGAEGGL